MPGPVSSSAASTARSTTPSASTGSQQTSAPSCRSSHSTVSRTAWCSTAEHRMRRRAGSCARAGPVESLDGEIVRFGAAGGENHLGGVGPGSGCQRLPGILHRPAGPAARAVKGRGVAGPGQLAGHRGQGLRGEGRGRGMIQVDGHASILPAAGAPARWTFKRRRRHGALPAARGTRQVRTLV